MANAERKKILEMLEEGIINVEEAEKLLKNIEVDVATTNSVGVFSGSKSKRFIRIDIVDGDDVVKVNIPFALAKLALSFVPKDAQSKLDENGVDLEKIIELVEDGADGELVNIQEGDSTKISIYID